MDNGLCQHALVRLQVCVWKVIDSSAVVSGITANWQQIVNQNLNIGKLEPKVGVLAHGCAHSWPFEHQCCDKNKVVKMKLVKMIDMLITRLRNLWKP